MTILLYSLFDKKSEKIPAVIIGLVLDVGTMYGMWDFIKYFGDYYGL